MKTAQGSFTMHHQGEVDVRGAYCVLASAKLLNLLTDELTNGVGEWIASLQNYDGGIGGDQFNESHGGYAFCGLAALEILGKTHLIDKTAFLKWAARRQMRVEGGFQGRQNKLVDGCYSFWQGGIFPILDKVFLNPEKYADNYVAVETKSEPIFGSHPGGWCFDQNALQEYLLACCQNSSGGLLDKPEKKTRLLSYLLHT